MNITIDLSDEQAKCLKEICPLEDTKVAVEKCFEIGLLYRKVDFLEIKVRKAAEYADRLSRIAAGEES